MKTKYRIFELLQNILTQFFPIILKKLNDEYGEISINDVLRDIKKIGIKIKHLKKSVRILQFTLFVLLVWNIFLTIWIFFVGK